MGIAEHLSSRRASRRRSSNTEPACSVELPSDASRHSTQPVAPVGIVPLPSGPQQQQLSPSLAGPPIGVCAVCTLPIARDSEHFENTWGELYHEEHNQDLPPCEYCGAAVCQPPPPIPDTGTVGPTRHACAHCRAGVVRDRKLLRAIWRRDVLPVLRDHTELDIAALPAITLGIVSQEAINRIAGTYHQDKESVTVVPVGNAPREERKYGILIRDDLPQEYAAVRLAHEALHVWMKAALFPTNLPHTVREGICEYAAYVVAANGHVDESSEGSASVRERRDDEIHRMDSIRYNPDPVYGVGFNQCRDAVVLMHGSFSAVIEFVRRKLWFPLDQSDALRTLSKSGSATSDSATRIRRPTSTATN